MVVVMIFLMASVIFMLRNVQLDADIERATEAEGLAVLESESLRERAAYLAEIVAQTNEQLDLTERQRLELERLSEARGARITELELETATLYRTQQQLNSEVADLNLQVDEIKEQRDTLTERVGSMNSTIAQLNALIDTKSTEYDTLQANFQARQDQLRLVEARLATRNRELSELQSTLTELEDLETRQRAQIALLEQVKTDREFQIQQLTTESGRKDEQIAQLTQTQQQQSQDIATQLSELDALQQSYHESLVSIDVLNIELEQRNAEIEELTASSSKLQDVVARLESTRSEQGATLESQEQEIESLRERAAQQLIALENLQQAYQAQGNELAGVQDELSDTLAMLENTRLTSADTSERQQQQITSISTQLSASEQTISQQRQELTSLKDRYTERLAELERIEADYIEREREASRLQTQLAATIERLDSLETVLAARDTQISSLNVEIASLDDELTSLAGSEKQSISLINQLNQELTNYRNQVSLQDRQITLLEQEVQRITVQNDDFKRELEYSRQLQADRQQQLETLQSVMQQLSDDLKARDERLETLFAENERLLKSGVRGDQEISQLRQAYQDRLEELRNLQQALSSRSGELEQLQGEVVELKEERQLMLRPARSPASRYVVEVYFTKSATGDPIYQYRLPNQSSATQVSRIKLEALLENLKNERAEGLYTKIIFPDESALSFSEAWAFTQHIQSNYDYYSQ